MAVVCNAGLETLSPSGFYKRSKPCFNERELRNWLHPALVTNWQCREVLQSNSVLRFWRRPCGKWLKKPLLWLRPHLPAAHCLGVGWFAQKSRQDLLLQNYQQHPSSKRLSRSDPGLPCRELTPPPTGQAWAAWARAAPALESPWILLFQEKKSGLSHTCLPWRLNL